MDEHRARPNEYAVLWAGLFGALSFVVLLVVLNPRSEDGFAYRAGQLFVPAAIATAVVGLVARRATRHVGWWVYALAVPIATAVLVLIPVVAGNLRESVEEVATPEVATPEVATPEEAVGMLSAPSAGHGWTVIDNSRTRAEVRRVTEGIANDAEGDVDSVVAGLYTHSSVPDSPVFFIGVNGELDPDSSADQALVNVLAGAGVDAPEDFDSGDVGGALGCGAAASQGLQWVTCAWVGNERAVLVRWSDRSIGMAQAAGLTRNLRERAFN